MSKKTEDELLYLIQLKCKIIAPESSDIGWLSPKTDQSMQIVVRAIACCDLYEQFEGMDSKHSFKAWCMKRVTGRLLTNIWPGSISIAKHADYELLEILEKTLSEKTKGHPDLAEVIFEKSETPPSSVNQFSGTW
jgi:hypothetical protein